MVASQKHHNSTCCIRPPNVRSVPSHNLLMAARVIVKTKWQWLTFADTRGKLDHRPQWSVKSSEWSFLDLQTMRECCERWGLEESGFWHIDSLGLSDGVCITPESALPCLVSRSLVIREWTRDVWRSESSTEHWGDLWPTTSGIELCM